ncbi:hypothetical protein ACFQY4_12110 [Catellatospora bangladeshensis]|uniref:DUF1273 family protein n=1 Tax=Catellatospora bangladeshensis TaxID=310355 RepID=A0A8J3JJL8_9ACTN|nr:hypothetical protein [Catellatospora bangladeshensis]GIF86012.1 hypothetical protein Cba03nite_73610 [Catellatospora bangladeshensis]
MPRIGVTGHTNLTGPTTAAVARALRELLAAHPAGSLVGVSCLAAGADTLFAEAVLDHGGRLEVVLPAADYRARKVRPEHAPAFDRLLGQAADVRVLPFASSGAAAYEAANETMLGSCELLVAVWDGRPAADRGGTGAVVTAARARGLPVTVVWPAGSARG